MRSLGWRQVVVVALSCSSLFAYPLAAQSLTVIGGTPIQQQLSACIEHLAAGDLNRLPGEDHTMTIVILDHEKFLRVKSSFHADLTRLAFSNLAIRRMYLSSNVFRDMDNVLRSIPHELGHFVTHSPYEDNAELAAERIRKRAREMCTIPPHALSEAQTNGRQSEQHRKRWLQYRKPAQRAIRSLARHLPKRRRCAHRFG
jgi:hypothetical protein